MTDQRALKNIIKKQREQIKNMKEDQYQAGVGFVKFTEKVTKIVEGYEKQIAEAKVILEEYFESNGNCTYIEFIADKMKRLEKCLSQEQKVQP